MPKGPHTADCVMFLIAAAVPTFQNRHMQAHCRDAQNPVTWHAKYTGDIATLDKTVEGGFNAT